MKRGESWLRPPAVAGRFYPGDAAELAREVEQHLSAGRAAAGSAPAPALALMAPHAGYMYSGGVAGQVFARVAIPERVVVMGPNHTGRGERVSVVPAGAYQVPGGSVPIDSELAEAILDEVPGARPDADAHRMEHSVEVEVPFLRALQPALRFVPMVLGALSERDSIAVGQGLARAVARVGGDVLVVASSDMSHYLPDAEARRVDKIALDALLTGDAAALHRTVRERDISMCGVIPTTAMLAYAGAAGATRRPDLVAYGTSGDTSGDRSRVVGYAGVIIAA
ncbi:MAG TPA: AmmeMemoRadiSam system protein B [Kofleriaceae bacterium]|nr:AmmeMemoRadiSam system protein B [Kofleriaceae bacterium]